MFPENYHLIPLPRHGAATERFEVRDERGVFRGVLEVFGPGGSISWHGAVPPTPRAFGTTSRPLAFPILPFDALDWPGPGDLGEPPATARAS